MFEEDTSPAAKANIEKLNQLLQLALPDINAGRKPDIAALAKQLGLDEQAAKDVLNHLLGRIGQLKKR